MPSLTSMLLSNQPPVGDYGCFSVVERLKLCEAAPFDYAVENRFHTLLHNVMSTLFAAQELRDKCSVQSTSQRDFQMLFSDRDFPERAAFRLKCHFKCSEEDFCLPLTQSNVSSKCKDEWGKNSANRFIKM